MSSLTSLVNDSDVPYIGGALAIVDSVEVDARRMHCEMFPEEYDYLLDDSVDAARRSKGENPMPQDYQDRVAKKCAELSLLKLCPSEMPDGSTYLNIYEDLLVKAIRMSENPEPYTRIINVLRDL